MCSVLLGGVMALLPIVASEILHVGPQGLGALRAMPAAGAMSMELFMAWSPIRRQAGAKLFVATAIFGLATIGFGLSQTLWLSMGFLFVIGDADVVSVVIRHTLAQGDTPDAVRGRVAAVSALFLGAAAALFGPVPAILIGGVGAIAVAVIRASMFPAPRNRDGLAEPTEPALQPAPSPAASTR